MPNVGDIIRASDLQDLLDKLNSSSSNIVGEFKYFGFLGVPEHCLACDGSEISRSAYSELFERYGTLYGEGDGSTTFNLPDFRGAFFRAIGGNSESLGIQQGDAIRNIKSVGQYNNAVMGVKENQWSYVTSPPFAIQSSYGYGWMSSGNQNLWVMTLLFDASTTGIPTAEENRPINFAVNVCVVYE